MLEIKLCGEFRHRECITIFKAQNLKCEKVRPIGGTVKYFYQNRVKPSKGAIKASFIVAFNIAKEKKSVRCRRAPQEMRA